MHGRSLAAALAVLITLALPAAASALTVSNTNDAGAGSLRQAILDANLTAGRDVVSFAGTGAYAIAPASDLPAITEPLVINALGADDAIRLTITGRGLSFGNAGGTTAGTGSQVLGVRVTGAPGTAVSA